MIHLHNILLVTQTEYCLQLFAIIIMLIDEFVLVPMWQDRFSKILILLFTRLYLDCRLTWAELDADSVCQAICREHWNFFYCFRLLLLSVFFSQSNFSPENSLACVRWIRRRKRENKRSIRFLDYHKVLSYCSARVCLFM